LGINRLFFQKFQNRLVEELVIILGNLSWGILKFIIPSSGESLLQGSRFGSLNFLNGLHFFESFDVPGKKEDPRLDLGFESSNVLSKGFQAADGRWNEGVRQKCIVLAFVQNW
jgi:hypothetical protein